MSFDLSGANGYFRPGNHIRYAIWRGSDPDMQTSALAAAKRDVERLLDDTLTDADASADGDFPRYDLAVYEQALWILVNGAVANAEETAPKWMLTGDPEAREGGKFGVRMADSGVGPEALKWLVSGGLVTLSRG
jgi:hypothetical protein